MNLLYLNHYAGSPRHGMEFRPFYLSREWVRSGHTVRIVAADFSHVRARQPDLGGRRELDEEIEGVRYTWLATPPYSGNGLGRVRNIASFLLGVRRRAGTLVRELRPDVVIASSTYPMDVWVARHLARRAGAVLVFEVHDLWPLSPIELGGMSRRHPFIQMVQAAEDAAYRDADVVVSMLPRVHDYMASRGLDLRKLHVVPNGIALEEWEGKPGPLPGPVAEAVAASRAAGRAIVGYAGSHGVPNALDTLLDVADRLRSRPIDFLLVGDGHEKARLAVRAREMGLESVRFLDPVPKHAIPAVLASIDVAFLAWKPSPLYRFGIAPNKLMDYMMAGLPVVHSVDAGNDPVAEAGCGRSTRAGDVAGTAAAIEELLALPAAERAALGARGRAFVRENHTYPVLARRFLEAIPR